MPIADDIIPEALRGEREGAVSSSIENTCADHGRAQLTFGLKGMRDRELGCVCDWVCLCVWGGGEGRIPVLPDRTQCNWRCRGGQTQRVSAQPWKGD